MSAVDVAQDTTVHTRGYQQEMLDESLKRNIIIAMDTGSGKTHIAVLRLKIEVEREPRKVCAAFWLPQSSLISIADIVVFSAHCCIIRAAVSCHPGRAPCICRPDIGIHGAGPVEG